MNQYLTPTELTKMSPTINSVNPNDRDACVNFWTNGRPDCIYMPMIDFLRWKNIKIKSDDSEGLITARAWTIAYRQVAADNQVSTEDQELFIKKSAANYLLFDIDFLLVYFDEAKELLIKDIFGS